jgi:hypothetical protein
MVQPMATHFPMWNWMITPLVYIMLKLKMENKQYGISFEVATSSQTKLQLQNFLHVLGFIFRYLNNSSTWFTR